MLIVLGILGIILLLVGIFLAIRYPDLGGGKFTLRVINVEASTFGALVFLVGAAMAGAGFGGDAFTGSEDDAGVSNRSAAQAQEAADEAAEDIAEEQPPEAADEAAEEAPPEEQIVAPASPVSPLGEAEQSVTDALAVIAEATQSSFSAIEDAAAATAAADDAVSTAEEALNTPYPLDSLTKVEAELVSTKGSTFLARSHANTAASKLDQAASHASDAESSLRLVEASSSEADTEERVKAVQTHIVEIGLPDKYGWKLVQIQNRTSRARAAADGAEARAQAAVNLVRGGSRDCQDAQCLFDKGRVLEDGDPGAALGFYLVVLQCGSSDQRTACLQFGSPDDRYASRDERLAALMSRAAFRGAVSRSRCDCDFVLSLREAARELQAVVPKVPWRDPSGKMREGEEGLTALFDRREALKPGSVRVVVNNQLLLTAPLPVNPAADVIVELFTGDRIILLGRSPEAEQWVEGIVAHNFGSSVVRTRVGWVNLRIETSSQPPLLGTQESNDMALEALDVAGDSQTYPISLTGG